MKTTPVNIPHVPWVNALEVGEWGRFPNGRMHLVKICGGELDNGPQGIPTIKLGHFPM